MQAPGAFHHLEAAAAPSLAAGFAEPKSNDGKFQWRPSSATTEKIPGPVELCILLAEDNVVNQRLISRILEKMGHSVMVANDGAAALVMLGATGFRSSSHGYANANHGWG